MIDRPVHVGILIDCSGSMSTYKNAVISGHHKMLESFRKSEKCVRGALIFGQILFNDQVTVLNKFRPLSPDGKDEIQTLTHSHYNAFGLTALYDAIIEMTKLLEKSVDMVCSEYGFLPAARLFIITDGLENASAHTKEDVQKAMANLRRKEWLEQSMIFGLRHADFDEDQLEKIREKISFSDALSFDRSEPEIRQACILASKIGAA